MIIIFSCITGLEPFHYVSLPSFSWDAGLLKTGEKLEVIRDIDKCLFIDRLVDIYQVINNDNVWYVKTNQGLCVEVSVLWDIVMPRPTFQNWKKILTLQNVHLPYWEWTQQIYMDTWVTFTNIDSWKILLILFFSYKAMSQPLPVGSFNFVDQKKMRSFTPSFIRNLDRFGKTGYFLEVDLVYPSRLHGNISQVKMNI